MFASIEEYNSFVEDYKLDTKKELSGILTTFSYGSIEQLAMRIVSFYDHKIEIGRKHYKEIGMVAFLTINHAAFREFIESIENAELKDCIIDLYNSNLNRRHTIDTEIVLTPMRFSGQETEVKKRINQMLQSVSQQKAPIRKAHGAELQPPRNQSPIDQLRHYKPTEEQRLQALRDMANISKDKMIQGIADYEIKKYERENPTEVLPRQIEMPTFLNVSEYKIVNFIFDKLEGILPK